MRPKGRLQDESRELHRVPKRRTGSTMVFPVLLPSQDMRGRKLAAPQKHLMAAVLDAALNDCRILAERQITFVSEQRTFEQAVAWVASTDRVWPFSFENICEALDLDAKSVRCKVTREKEE